MHLRFPVVFANLEGEVAFTHTVIKSAYFKFVAPLLVALNPFVFVWVIKSFYSSMAFWAL
jgi:hypothetical protein